MRSVRPTNCSSPFPLAHVLGTPLSSKTFSRHVRQNAAAAVASASTSREARLNTSATADGTSGDTGRSEPGGTALESTDLPPSVVELVQTTMPSHNVHLEARMKTSDLDERRMTRLKGLSNGRVSTPMFVRSVFAWSNRVSRAQCGQIPRAPGSYSFSIATPRDSQLACRHGDLWWLRQDSNMVPGRCRRA